MEFILGLAGSVITVVSFVGVIAGWCINKGIISPLSIAITALQETIKEFRDVVDNLKQEQHEIDKRLVVVEQSAKSAHHRLDGLEEVIRK